MRKCETCQRELELTEFYKNAGYYDRQCKQCRVSNPRRRNQQKQREVDNAAALVRFGEPGKRCGADAACIHPDGPVLPLTEFSHDKSHKDGYSSRCKKCKQVPVDRWLKENAEYKKQHDHDYAKQRKIDHPELVLEQGRRGALKYLKNHPDYTRNRYLSIRGKRNEQIKQYQKANPNVRKAAKQRYRARKLALPDTMTAADIQRCLDYWHGCCAVCGNPVGLFHTIALDHWIPLSKPNCPGTVPTNMIPLCHSIQGGENCCNKTKSNRDPLTWLIQRFGKRKAAIILERIETYFQWVNDQIEHDTT